LIKNTCKIIIICILTILALNVLLYYYLEWQPLRLSAEPDKTWGYAHVTLPMWHGLLNLKEPVDNIILGDSAAGVCIDGGIISDLLGGTTLNLANTGGSGLIMDGWMLKEYINRFGAPRNVILLRVNNSYEFKHNLEFLAVLPLNWGYWDNYGLKPDWEPNELCDLFIKKYIVIYSNSDILRDRFIHPWTIFLQPIWSVGLSKEYDRGIKADPQAMEKIINEKSPEYYRQYQPSVEATRSLQFMCDLAQQKRFQLYILQGPENDMMFQDEKRKDRIVALQTLISQFVDNNYTHLVPESPMVFSKDQMQNPNHLSPEAARKYSQGIATSMIGIQNKLTEGQVKPSGIISVIPDKSVYSDHDIANITVQLSNYTDDVIAGAVSCLVKPVGDSDESWVARATAEDFQLAANGTTYVKLIIDKGQLINPGQYDIVTYLRIPAGNNVNEIRQVWDHIIVQ